MSRSLAIPIRIRAITVLVTFIALAGIPITTIQASQSPALTVMDQTADIDYGNKITISTIVETEVESQEIEAVRTLFKARGGSTIWSYSYPDFSTNGSTSSQITVTFDILTGPGSYYPPGTDFDIEIEVTLTTGEVLSVQSSEPVEYLDPSNDWQREKGNGYTIIYYGVSQSAVKNMIATIDNRIPTLEATLGVTETPNFKAVVFPSIQSAAPSFPPVSQSATDQFLFAGFAQPEYRLFVQGQINSSTFTHELAHLYTHEAVSGSFLGGIPAWLNEGLARFLESGSSENSNNRLRSNVRPDELLSLNHMGTVPGLRSDVIIFYPQAGAFVGYLVEKYSPTTMSEFLAMLNKGRSVQDAFELIFDTTLREAENDWRALFGAEPLTIPSATVDPADTIDNSVPATSVPLVDYSASAPSTNQPSSTTTPEYLPTITPENPAVNPMVTVDDEPTTNWLVAGIVIGLSAIVGLWLFTSRRRMPKRNS